MANLLRSTRRADSVRQECLCVEQCEHKHCALRGRWHNHDDEVCPVHPDRITA